RMSNLKERNVMNRVQTEPSPGSVGGLSISDLTLPEFVLEGAPAHGAKRALVEPETGRELTYAQLVSAVGGWASDLQDRGLGPGEVIAVCAPNTLDFIVAVYAAMSTGAAVTPVNPMATVAEIERHLRRSGADRVMTTGALYAEKTHAAARSAEVSETYVIDD